MITAAVVQSETMTATATVTCRLCGQPFARISATHLQRKHGTTSARYQERFPDARMTSEDVVGRMWTPARRAQQQRAISEHNSRWWTPERRAQQAEVMSTQASERWQDEGYREQVGQKIAEGQRRAWAREDTRSRHERAVPATQRRRLNTLALIKDDDPGKWERICSGLNEARNSGLCAEAARQWWADLSQKERLEISDQCSQRMKHAWERGAFDKSSPWTRWYTEEKIVRGWLRDLGLYRTGSKTKGTPGFVPHGRMPTKGLGFVCSADFIDYNYGLIIHVDGPAHYADWHPGLKKRLERDPQIDAWCVEHGWVYLRLTDQDIQRKPVMCRNMIRRLVRGRVVPLIRG